jgi:tRNA-2-methylthio-N6-dimethylallyladenosine synthase
MNVSDSEIVASLLAAHPAWFQMIDERDPASATQADIVLLNTCAIREKPEARVLQRLCMLRAEEQRRGSGWPRRILGLLGCMAERLKTRLLSETPSKRLVDLVIGPDGYRDLPLLLQGLLGTMDPQRYAYHTQLSLEETYADIAPLRHRNRITAYLSIMRGCNNHCAFCIVPQTRGPERSRDPDSICREVEHLGDQGFRELVLLGQNVNSYRYIEDSSSPRIVTFAALLQRVCEIADQYPMRIRFTSPHPKDFSDDILDLYAKFAPRTLCRQIHVPVQSGSTAVLQRMRRGYTREEYLDLIQRIRDKVGGDVALSTDIISGFCDETEEEHAETLSLMDRVRFDQAFMFAYSERERTIAARLYTDNIPSEVKLRRLGEIITKQLSISAERARALIGTRQRVLIDEAIQRNAGEDPNTAGHEEHTPWSWIGRTESNRKVRIIPGKIRDPANCLSECQQEARLSPGDWADVRITSLHGHRLAGELVS